MLSRVFDAGSIFHPYYVASGFAVMLTWLLAQGEGPRAALRQIFARDTWLHRSVAVDLVFCAGYLLVLRSLSSTVETTMFTRAYRAASWALTRVAPVSWSELASMASQQLMATAVTMLAFDLASYGMHRWLHSSRLLWKVHRLHHSAERLTPLTTYRQHPLEPLLLFGARGAASGLALAAFYRAFPQRAPVLMISGLGAGFFIYMFTVNLHHCAVPVRYPRWLRAVLVSPHVHQLHHSASPRHHGANFGVVFSFWDRLFGTYVDEQVRPGELRFGLAK